MRWALWLIGMFALAVAGAWVLDHNQASVAFFVHPYRIDVSLNLLLLLLVLGLALLLLAQKALSTLWSMPQRARAWRLQRHERAAHEALFQAMAEFMAGRYVRAHKSAETALAREQALHAQTEQPLAHASTLRALAHLVVAESAHALQDHALREHHLQLAQQQATHTAGNERQALIEGLSLRAARWLLDDRDASGSLRLLTQLPAAAKRRTLALRLELKAARLAGQTARALEVAMLLGKHRAFTPEAAATLMRNLLLERLSQAQDTQALEKLWQDLPPAQQALPDVGVAAASRWVALGGSGLRARAWLLSAWEVWVKQPSALSEPVRQSLVRTLEHSLREDGQASDGRDWLVRMEALQRAQPNDSQLQYLAGMVYLRLQLWGKAQVLLTQAARGLQDTAMKRQVWVALAQLAEQRQDSAAALLAWRTAAEL